MHFNCWLIAPVALAVAALATGAADKPGGRDRERPIPGDDYDWAVPDESQRAPARELVPITFVSRGQNRAEWEKLPRFWNEVTEDAVDPATGTKEPRKAVKIKLPLGLNLVPPVPPENPMTVGKWRLGKALYFDPALSSDGTVSCASCHSPSKGFTDQRKVSTGIFSKLGGMNAPTVLNAAYNRFQFWDGRAVSLEDQAQGPVGNPAEMFAGEGNAWHEAIKRVRKEGEYNKGFLLEFGHLPTRDAVAKAIATYERTVLSGNSVHDRAEAAMRKRVEDEEGTNFAVAARDYETVLKEAFGAQDANALKALGLDPARDAGKVADTAARVNNGRALFFGKARCNLCHVGETFTDHTFHNLGVVVVDGKLPPGQEGRYGALPLGHKDPSMMGAFKTPPLRGLLSSGPYLHDGSETSLEAVVDFYDKGGNANEFLDPKMRDVDAEDAYLKAKRSGQNWTGPEVKVFTRSQRPIIPFKLNLTPDEKKDLVLFLRALQGDPIDSVLTDRTR